MFKKTVLLIAIALSALLPSVQAAPKDDITMLVVPREVLPIQIAQDISRRYPVLLVSYQLTRSDLKIFAWDGDAWVTVSQADYTKGTFFANRPKHAIVVEHERFRAPDALIPSSLWCESANRLTSTDPRAMLHLLGLHFDFPYRYWDQLAKRYGYALEEINPTLANVHWWNLRTDVLLEKRANRDFAIDLNKWFYLEPVPPSVAEPVIARDIAAAPKPTEAASEVKISVKPVEPVAPVVPAVKPEPEVKAAPAVEATPIPEPAPFVEVAPVVAPAPIIEMAVTEPVATEEDVVAPPVTAAAEAVAVSNATVSLKVDPFAADEIPAAEIVLPPEPEKKRPWWKIF